MLGLIVTLLAVFLVICLALHSSDHGFRADLDFLIGRKGPKRGSE